MNKWLSLDSINVFKIVTRPNDVKILLIIFFSSFFYLRYLIFKINPSISFKLHEKLIPNIVKYLSVQALKIKVIKGP